MRFVPPPGTRGGSGAPAAEAWADAMPSAPAACGAVDGGRHWLRVCDTQRARRAPARPPALSHIGLYTRAECGKSGSPTHYT